MPEYAERLYLTHLLKESAIRAAIRSLALLPSSRGLDAGCGPGYHATHLAEAVGPMGHVTGLDISADFLDRGRRRAGELGFEERISFIEGSILSLPFDTDHFDWAWSADTIWPGPKADGCIAEKPGPTINELVRVTKPGGLVAVVFWSSQKLLPGYPFIEARLNGTERANAPLKPGGDPETHFMRALSWLERAGLQRLKAESFAADICPPISPDIRRALAFTFDMFWGQVKDEVTDDDWKEYNRLCDPDSPDFLPDTPGYSALITYTVFSGRK